MDALAWWVDWAWGIPLILFTVVQHVCGLGVIYQQAIRLSRNREVHRRPLPRFLVWLAVAALMATVLHGIEASAWAAAYVWLGALPDGRIAMLYSLGAMTSYGHVGVFLPDGWQLLGALEALNGMMLFGLTTAFLFGIIQKIWPVSGR